LAASFKSVQGREALGRGQPPPPPASEATPSAPHATTEALPVPLFLSPFILQCLLRDLDPVFTLDRRAEERVLEEVDAFMRAVVVDAIATTASETASTTAERRNADGMPKTIQQLVMETKIGPAAIKASMKRLYDIDLDAVV
jgi:hypothetical protein